MTQQPSPPPPSWTFEITKNLINNNRSPPVSAPAAVPAAVPAAATPAHQHSNESAAGALLSAPLISPLPSNAVVISPATDEDASFSRYIENQYGSDLHDRLSQQSLKPQQHDATIRSNPISEGTTLQMDDDLPSLAARTEQQQHQPTVLVAAAGAKEAGLPGEHDDAAPAWGYEYNMTPPWWVARFDEDGMFSAGALLFLFGFILPPLWWIGAFWPRRSREHGGKMAERWQNMNRIMSIGFSILAILAIIICVAVWKSE